MCWSGLFFIFILVQINYACGPGPGKCKGEGSKGAAGRTVYVHCSTTITTTTTTSTTSASTSTQLDGKKDTCIDYGLPAIKEREITCMDKNGNTRSICETWRETHACKTCLCQCKYNLLKKQSCACYKKLCRSHSV